MMRTKAELQATIDRLWRVLGTLGAARRHRDRWLPVFTREAKVVRYRTRKGSRRVVTRDCDHGRVGALRREFDVTLRRLRVLEARA